MGGHRLETKEAESSAEITQHFKGKKFINNFRWHPRPPFTSYKIIIFSSCSPLNEPDKTHYNVKTHLYKAAAVHLCPSCKGHGLIIYIPCCTAGWTRVLRKEGKNICHNLNFENFYYLDLGMLKIIIWYNSVRITIVFIMLINQLIHQLILLIS